MAGNRCAQWSKFAKTKRQLFITTVGDVLTSASSQIYIYMILCHHRFGHGGRLVLLCCYNRWITPLVQTIPIPCRRKRDKHVSQKEGMGLVRHVGGDTQYLPPAHVHRSVVLSVAVAPLSHSVAFCFQILTARRGQNYLMAWMLRKSMPLGDWPTVCHSFGRVWNCPNVIGDKTSHSDKASLRMT
jgi:hypothetical protein